MLVLILGLVLFLGIHCTRIVADGQRSAFIAQRGENAWKALYTVASLLGFGLIVWGYGLARQLPVVLWSTPPLLKHAAGLLTLVSFVLLTAAYVPGNGIKARLHHPMTLGIKVWAFAHLLANNTVADLLLFGGFLAWSIAVFVAARRRDRVNGAVYAPGSALRSAMTVVIGSALWLAFVAWGHRLLIGVAPLG